MKALVENHFQNGLEINARVNDGQSGSPMHAAVYNGHEDIVDYLLKNASELDIDPEFFNGHVLSPYELAKQRGQEGIALMFKGHDWYYDMLVSTEIDITASNQVNPDHAQVTEYRHLTK